ncbi:MAG: hypothetical protein JJ992_09580, partial [Planctomycetes bacterium]|nr:hypothetical protein [Planctomycetota bacterium]
MTDGRQEVAAQFSIGIMILMLAGASTAADSEIHRCVLDDGTIAFQQKPCSEATASADDSSEVGESKSAG